MSLTVDLFWCIPQLNLNLLSQLCFLQPVTDDLLAHFLIELHFFIEIGYFLHLLLYVIHWQAVQLINSHKVQNLFLVHRVTTNWVRDELLLQLENLEVLWELSHLLELWNLVSLELKWIELGQEHQLLHLSKRVLAQIQLFQLLQSQKGIWNLFNQVLRQIQFSHKNKPAETQHLRNRLNLVHLKT